MLPIRIPWALVVVALAGSWLYRDVLAGLVNDWAHDDNYSHGFLIVPLARYFAWERRDRLTARSRSTVAWSAWSWFSAAWRRSWPGCWAPSSSWPACHYSV